MTNRQKTLQQKHMLPMADFAEMLLDDYARKVHKLEREIRQLQNKKRR